MYFPETGEIPARNGRRWLNPRQRKLGGGNSSELGGGSYQEKKNLLIGESSLVLHAFLKNIFLNSECYSLIMLFTIIVKLVFIYLKKNYTI